MIYPESRVLERSIARSIVLLSKEDAAASAPDTRVAVSDNFRNTRGNYEQHRFSSKILEALRDALEGSQTEQGVIDIADPGKELDLELLTWAEKKNDLGNVLAALGQLRRDESSFEKAIQCFEMVLEVLSQENSPLLWAEAKYNLGTASQALGRIIESTKPFKIAVDAYTDALKVWKRENSPEEWMFTMHQLGASLHAHGKLLKGNRQFQKSVVAYKNALAVLDADNYALELTATHNNRAAVLHHLAESEENPERLKEAIKAYEKALTVSMEQQLPIHLAVLCRVNLATARNVLARWTSDPVLAEEMADEFELIMECFPHALQPLCLKHCQEEMKLAQSILNAVNS